MPASAEIGWTEQPHDAPRQVGADAAEAATAWPEVCRVGNARLSREDGMKREHTVSDQIGSFPRR